MPKLYSNAGMAAWEGRMRRVRSLSITLLLALLGFAIAGWSARAADDTIKIGYIDPFSGAFASGGDASLKMFQFILDYINGKGGALGKKFELVTFDDKLQPSEALIALKNVTDQNIPFVMSCVGSNVGSALIDAVNKHNERNPDNRVLLLNCGALATELTNEQCSFWHFRFIGNVAMRAVARIKSLPKTVTSVYFLNQDYLFGQSIEHDTKRYLAEYRPDIKIVADEFIPLMQIKDFAPYITKIKASGAQSLVTGNYGPDLNLLIKAGVDAGLNIRYDAYLAQVIGAATAIGSYGDGRLTSVMEDHENIPVEEHNAEAEEFFKKWRATHDFAFIDVPNVTQFEMMVRAINQAGSTDAVKVAQALEGMEQKDLFGAVNIMRKDDHQLLEPYYEAVFTKGVTYDVEKTGLGWKTEFKTTVADETLPTTCKMKRPSS
jgi:branched-chain amino acid transport system substrate-binding protein